MARLTEQQKQQILDLTRRGWNRTAAATEVGTTGSRVRKMVNQHSANYDHDFAVAYNDALLNARPDGTAPRPAETPWPERDHKTINGHTKWNALQDEDLDRYLEMVENGVAVHTAAHEIGTSWAQIDRRRKYDPDFAERYTEALTIGYPAYQARLEATAMSIALDDKDYKAVRDQMIVHLPRYREALKTTRHEVGGFDGGPIEIIKTVFPTLPSKMIDELIAAFEQNTIDAADIVDLLPPAPEENDRPEENAA